jgi:hypothetical protein
MSKVRGIRFNEREEAMVEEFLIKNPLLDFTTLAKIAILEFIKDPKFNLKAVSRKEKKGVRDERTI